MQYHRQNRRKYLLLFHVIFVVKYRKKILKNDLAETVKLSVLECAKASSFDVPEMEVDQDHLHMMIDLSPSYSISQLVRRLKQTTNNALWERHGSYLRRQFWLERTFWSDGYFCCSIGNANIQTIQQYIRNQG